MFTKGYNNIRYFKQRLYCHFILNIKFIQAQQCEHEINFTQFIDCLP